MSTVSDYWHLQRLDSAGRCRRQLIEDAQSWLRTQRTVLADADLRALQMDLLALWRQAPTQMVLALLCLRCCVSHAIRLACLQLVSQFGDYYQFQGADLFPYVLDDDGKPLGQYRPLGVQVVETYTPGKASLESWAIHLTRNHVELNQFLIERGLYRVSDWAILNDTTPSQLPKLLGEFHQLTAGEVTAAQQLLQRYHQIYRRDRLQPGQPRSRRRCQPPTEAQLQAINDSLSPQTVLAKLRQLAYWLRQYRIQTRGGTPLAESWNAMDQTEIPSPQMHEADDPQDTFLQTYRQQLEISLEKAIAETLQTYCTKLQRKKTPKDQAFLKALTLFHCQGKSMSAIAPEVGLTTQVQVSRLMNLKQFRADVRNALLTHLKSQVQDAVLAVTSVEQLQSLGDRLNALLAEEGDRVIAEAASEAQIPRDRPTRSLFARTLCQYLSSFEF